jgi:hypothetical protein
MVGGDGVMNCEEAGRRERNEFWTCGEPRRRMYVT